MLKAKLVVVGGDAKAAEVRLNLPTVIGRGREANLTVPHALVSRRHTEIFEKEGKLFVRDLGSLNGTFVNNTKIEGDQLLDPNQLLTLGNVTFRAVYEAESSAEETEDTVTFDEVRTAVNTSSVVPLKDAEPVKFEIDETVPIDTLSKPKKITAPAKAKVEAEAKPKKAKPEESKLDENKDKASVLETEGKSNSPSSDTDKSIISSDVFKFEAEEVDPANKSVSVSALDDLPSGVAPAVSFVGKVDFGEDVKKPASQIDPVKIDLGEEEKGEAVDEDSSLGSFLNKLPR